MKYVFPHLMGGIGNRLFQVCAAYGYALKHNFQFILIINEMESNRYTNEDHTKTILSKCPITRSVNQIKKLNKFITFSEPCHLYTDYIPLPENRKNLKLYGYFQNEAYFDGFKPKILDLFKMEISRHLNLLEKYPKLLRDSIFFHIRTFTVQHMNGQIEVADEKHRYDFNIYFQNCLNFLKTKGLSNVHVFILTDHRETMEKMYKPILSQIKSYEIVTATELDSLYLMTLTKYGGICSNSSFSWWGSYLNKSPDKLVLMPSEWLKQPWPCHIYPKNAEIINIHNIMSYEQVPESK